MRLITFPILLLICLMFCRCSNSDDSALLNSDSVPYNVYVIRTDRDTVLRTTKGAVISIRSGTLQTASGNARLAIKEVYTIKDMMLAGLTTRSDNNPLSSGGMINISVDGDEKVTINKPIEVAIPTNFVRPGMQLYKGESMSDGKINWVDPQNLEQRQLSISNTLKNGKVLFVNNCVSCHDPIKESTGPPLAFLSKRRDKEWLYWFVYNPTPMIADYSSDHTFEFYHDDGYANCIYNYYNKTAMTAFPNLSREEVDNIFEYVDYVAKDTDPSSIRDYKAAFDSCKLYNKLTNELTAKRQKLIAENGNQAKKEILQRPADAPQETGGTAKPENLVKPENFDAEYYKFNIQTFGWYNVDILMTGLPGFEDSELMVRITGRINAKVNVYMALPKYRILLDGGLIKGEKDTYGFYTKDGKLPLPQAARAVIFAVGADKQQLYFGEIIFTSTMKQSLEIKMRPVSRQEIDSAIRNYNFEGITFTSEMMQNASELREIDSVIEVLKGLKPVGWDCDCAFPPAEIETIITDTTK